MQDLAHAVQRQIEHIIILEVAADVSHDKGRLAVLALLGGVFCLFFGLRLLRLGLGGGQLFQLPLRLDLRIARRTEASSSSGSTGLSR